MPDNPTQLIDEIAAAKADMTLSLRRVMAGYLERIGGPESLGQILGDLQLDEQANIASRVSLANNMTKLLATFGEQDDGEDDWTPEQIEARLSQLPHG